MRTRLPSLYWEVAKVLRGYGVPNVTEDSFSPFPPQLLPAKPWSSEWWAWRKIPRRWRATIKANGTPAGWETSAGCSCVTSRRQNTPDLLRKHTFDCGTMNCVIVSSKYIDSISVLYLYCFICYKLLQLLKYAHIFSVYTKMRLFKSQKTSGDRAKLFIKLNSAHLN